MASSSGTKNDFLGPPRSLSLDSIIVPPALHSIAPIFRVADEIEKDNPRVANLCRFGGFKKACLMDPTSSGRQVRQFKTLLLHKLKKEEIVAKPSESVAQEILKYYHQFYENHQFYEKNIKDGGYTKKREEMTKNCRIATVLYDVLMTVAPQSPIDEQTLKMAEDVKKNREQYVNYNILPLYTVGVKPAIMELPEIKAALHALQNINSLPMSTVPTERNKPVNDILDWLSSIFGFQKGNVENQREHLLLLLANMNVRQKNLENYTQLNSDTVQQLWEKVFENYDSWINYLHRESNIGFPPRYDRQQLKLIYIALYLLIWGEASNIRFMPECLCYIFHQMANEVYEILSSNAHWVTGETYQTAGDEESFLRHVVTPIYEVLDKEAKRNENGKASHSRWRNYDDLNEYFWSDRCFRRGWRIMARRADFFRHLDGIQPTNERPNQAADGRRKPKTNFVEVRTFWHLYRSFDRMWIFLILAFQAMIIVAWSPSGSLTAFFDADVFSSVLSIFITNAFLNLLQATLDIILSWHCWKSLEFTQILRYLLKFAVAGVWAVVLPIGYSSSVQSPTGLIKFFSSWARDWRNQSFYNYAVALYLLPNLLATVLFFLPRLQRHLELSNGRIATLFMWWAQPKLYIGRGLHEDFFSLLKYTLFWIMLLISKLSFSYYVEILPLVAPTKIIIEMSVSNYQWHEFFPNACAYYKFTFGTAVVTHNIGAVIAIWAPIVLVYFMDGQIWYAIFSTIFGGIHAAFNHLGEIRTLGMLRSRVESVPSAFSDRLMPSQNEDANEVGPLVNKERERKNIDNFSHVWNAFITSMRGEDLISNRERDLLLVPYSSGDVSVVQCPPSLLASKIAIALDLAKDSTGNEDNALFGKIKRDICMYSAVIECYQTLKDIIYGILEDEADKKIVKWICDEVDSSIDQKRFLTTFRMSGLPFLSESLEKFLKLLLAEDENVDNSMNQIIALQNVMEIITHDVMINGHKKLKAAHNIDPQNVKEEQRFQTLKIDQIHNTSWREKVVRFRLLLTFKESAINVPQNLDARRRITFFANSLFMKMPRAPKVRDMLSFSVLTPYYKEDVIYSDDELNRENEDGITILFYLKKIYPDEWTNFKERLEDHKNEISPKDSSELTRQWVSYRAQTLSRTVRGMMYYREALHLQCGLENDEQAKQAFLDPQALADLKFTYVVSCQVYGAQKSSNEPRDRSCYTNILNLMLKYPSLRVAYIDTVEEAQVNGEPQKTYFSVLVKGGDSGDEEIYRIKLPGPPTEIGEGKPENQNHAIIFTRGEALQTIDMNQDNYFEEAFKMRNVLEEFLKPRRGDRKPTILGLREHIFTGSVSSLAWFMSNQETSFVTIGQRILANPLRVRFHYGHPDIFDRIFHITRGGISKASKTINLSEDIFAGYNSTMRGGFITHHEYIQVGKGRDVGMNPISLFEAKVSSGNGEQTLSRDVYRLGHRFDFYRMLSFYFTTVGFYFSSMVSVLTVYVFLYGHMYMVMSGLKNEILDNPAIHGNKAFEEALVTQSVFQLGLLLVLPMVMEIGIEKGFRTALGNLIIMQLQLASVFFTFQLGTKAHYYGRTILHGGSKYLATGRGFVVVHAKFSENYRHYSRSHFVKGLELLILLIVYRIYGGSYRSSNLYLFTTFSIWFLVASWLFAPFIFNPSGLDWQKTVDDWTDWNRWMGNPGGIGISPDKSWETWWDEQQEHLKSTDTWGRILEIILATRFLIYQYGIVYQLDIANHSKSSLVYGLSWIVIVTLLLVLKIFSLERERVYSDMQLMIRILKPLMFLGFISVMTILFLVCGLTIADIFAAILAFLPTGWAILLIGQACRPMFKGLGFWESIKELGRAYDHIMGLVIFTPIAILSWFPLVSEFQTRILFNQAFSRGLQISRILAGRKDKTASRTETEKMHLH